MAKSQGKSQGKAAAGKAGKAGSKGKGKSGLVPHQDQTEGKGSHQHHSRVLYGAQLRADLLDASKTGDSYVLAARQLSLPVTQAIQDLITASKIPVSDGIFWQWAEIVLLPKPVKVEAVGNVSAAAAAAAVQAVKGNGESLRAKDKTPEKTASIKAGLKAALLSVKGKAVKAEGRA